MEKSKDFGYIKFHSSIIRMAIERCRSLFPGIGQNAVLRVSLGEVTWDFDSIDEFLTAHAHQSVDRVHLQMYWREMHDGFTVQFTHKTIISVRSNSRAAIEAIFSVFEEAGKDCWVETYPDQEISIFIGHGG